jgi:multimeric flavodoxin WrbA
MPDEDRNADLLVLCAPVWATQLPGAVKTYLDDYSPRHVKLVTINQGNRNKSARARADEVLQLELPTGTARLSDLSSYRAELDALAARLSGS